MKEQSDIKSESGEPPINKPHGFIEQLTTEGGHLILPDIEWNVVPS